MKKYEYTYDDCSIVTVEVENDRLAKALRYIICDQNGLDLNEQAVTIINLFLLDLDCLYEAAEYFDRELQEYFQDEADDLWREWRYD